MAMTKEDHDLLITHSGKIDALCNLIKEHMRKIDITCDRKHAAITETHKEIFTKVDKKTDSTVFRWAISLLFVSQMALFSVIGVVVLDTRANEQSIDHLEKFFDKESMRWEISGSVDIPEKSSKGSTRY